MAGTGGATALERLRSLASALAPGELLPSERALAAELGVARMTVRGAIDVLAREGLVRTRRGVGTERLSPP
ncbi:MAG TPA: GntR family transcriptional regulator, partial [Agrococcus sp.]|nr:GntR family transcriptional regulator [Agrococcus sp.]